MIIHTNLVAIQSFFLFWLKRESVILKICINSLELNLTQPIASFAVLFSGVCVALQNWL